MPMYERDGVSLRYEEFGDGFPLILFAPGGMHSTIQFWRSRPDSPGEKLPWIDPTADLSDTFRVIAMDQRNAGGSRAQVGPRESWVTYTSDAIALLDHLGIEQTHAMGGCIGSSFVLALVKAVPAKVTAAVLQNPIGLSADNRASFEAMFDGWARELAPDHPETDESTWASFREAMFGGDFVFSVSRDFVRGCPVPLLVLPGGDAFHPRPVAEEIVALAPRAELLDDWAGEERKPATREQIRSFLLRHTPRDALR
jgi:pimeloyl-ACP methyl ester carboxylesterase